MLEQVVIDIENNKHLDLDLKDTIITIFLFLTDQQTDRQTERKTDRNTDRPTDRQTDTVPYRSDYA